VRYCFRNFNCKSKAPRNRGSPTLPSGDPVQAIKRRIYFAAIEELRISIQMIGARRKL
jgi:hypothetical protein